MSENHAKSASRPHRVVVLAVAPIVGFDAAIPSLIFGNATDDDGNPLYEVITCGVDDGPIPSTSDYQWLPAAGPQALAEADTVIVPGTKAPAVRVRGILDAPLQEALSMIAPEARLVSICTGAFVLGAAGLLDDRPVTTHWRAADEFTRLYPRAQLDESVLFVDDGNLLSSAGLAAGIDLCLHIVRRDHGAAVANRVARYCVVPPWREGGQAQFIERPVPEPQSGRSTAATQQWALGRLAESLSVARLAGHAGMSSRTFTRRFVAETGSSPGAWIRDRRVDLARELLESADLPVDRVAELAGLGSADNLRHHLRRGLGMSPSAYRRTFAGSR